MAKTQSSHQLGENRAPSTAVAVIPEQPAGAAGRTAPAQPARARGPAQPAGQAVRPGGQPGGQQGGQPGQRPLNQLLARALEFHRTGRYREAEPIYRAVLERAPKRVGALINFSSLLRATGRGPQAREMAERAVEAGPDNALAHFTLGATLRQLRRDKEAIESYEKAVALDPSMTKAWVNLAVSSERFDRKRSVEAQEKVLAAEPDNLVALNMKLKNGLQECDFDAAECGPGACWPSSTATWTRWGNGGSWPTLPIAPCSCRCPRRCCCAPRAGSTASSQVTGRGRAAGALAAAQSRRRDAAHPHRLYDAQFHRPSGRPCDAEAVPAA